MTARAQRLTILNDRHSALNATPVAQAVRPQTAEEVARYVCEARESDRVIIPHGCRHSMGGQQFAAGGIALATGELSHIGSFNADTCTLEAGAGATWENVRAFLARQPEGSRAEIRQKQTGADHLSLGGALASNIHGRGLSMHPFVEDVEDLTLVDANGEVRRCSRTENPKLFAHATGGYGLFGIVTSLTLRLAAPRNYRRRVHLSDASDAIAAFEERAREGDRFGDFQFEIDPASSGFLRSGILSTYTPSLEPASPSSSLAGEDWLSLLTLAHTHPAQAYEGYAAHYLATHGTIYSGADVQFTEYQDGYHSEIDRRCGHTRPHGEMISEFYVPRCELDSFLGAAATLLRRRGPRARVIYGTVRIIEPDTVTALPWAREPWACIVLNLCVEHSEAGIAAAQRHFRGLADLALERAGSFYLTYHR